MKELIGGVIIAAILMAVVLYLVLLATKKINDAEGSVFKSEDSDTQNLYEDTNE